MDESEKLAVSRKAIAEIILNTSREAAARIMVTERKAKRYQQELLAAKGESLHMLNHMKQMMDCKIAEAEKKSLSQKQKIEELEAQLNEAEDIVRDLRDELREVQFALEKIVRNNQSRSEEPKVKVYKPNREEEFQEKPDRVITFVDKNSSTCQNSNNLHLKNQLVGNPDFASLMTMNKEPELSRKGCTQRIRAFETTLLDRTTPLSGLLHDQVMERCLPSVLSSSKISLHPVNIQHGEDPSKEKDRKIDTIDSEVIAGENKKPLSIEHVLNVDSYQSETIPNISDSLGAPKNPESRPPSAYQSCEAEKDKKSGFVGVSVGKGGVLKSCDAEQITKTDDTLADKVELSTQENESIETSVDLVKKMNQQMANATLNSDVNKIDETKNVTSSQPTNDRLIVYTFQRKRKKKSLSSPDVSATPALEERNLKRRKEDESLSSQDSEKSSLINEPTRESRRLAQVARQLISLSEKKWWQ